MSVCEYQVVLRSHIFPLSFIAQDHTLDLATADKFNVIFCFFVCSMFGLSTGSLFIFHVYLSLFNRTTLGMYRVNTSVLGMTQIYFATVCSENMQWPRTVEGSERRLYFVGFKANLKQVFGKNCLLALLPVASM